MSGDLIFYRIRCLRGGSSQLPTASPPDEPCNLGKSLTGEGQPALFTLLSHYSAVRTSVNIVYEYLKNLYSIQGRQRPVLIVDNRLQQTKKMDCSLLDIKPARPTVVRLATRKNLVYLDFSVYDIFRTLSSEIASVSLKLEDHGYRLLGELVQATEEELLELPFMNYEVIGIMKCHLRRTNFEFGMQIPHWNRSRSAYLAKQPNL